MSLWTKTDGAAGKPKNLTTAEKLDVFGVDAAELALRTGKITGISEVLKGSGYPAVPVVTITSEAVTGIDSVADVDAVTEIISATAHPFSNGDKVKYSNGAGTSIGGLVTTNDYFIISALVNSFQLSLTKGGVAIDLTDGVGVAHSFTGGAGATATAVLTNGKVSGITVTAGGDGTYTDGVTAVIAAPAAVVVDAAAIAGDVLTEAAHPFETGDLVLLTNVTGIFDGNLATGTSFYLIVLSASTLSFASSKTNALAGVAIVLAGDGTGLDHTLTGQTATVDVALQSESVAGVAHTGWVKRTVGKGGRAGRVHYEVLVAGGITGDAADDIEFPDA